jgi:hypothetical protein
VRVVPAALLVEPRLLLRLSRIPLGPILRALFIRRLVVGLELLLLVRELGTGIVRRGRTAGKAWGRVRWVVGRGSGYVAWF